MIEVKSVEPLENLRLRLCFTDGLSGIVELGHHLHGTAFEGLRDQQAFNEVFLHEGMGTVAWPNNADFAAAFLHEEVAKAAAQPLPA